MLPLIAFVRVGGAGTVTKGVLPAGLNTGAETDADIRDGDVIGDEFATDAAELIDARRGRPAELELNGCAVADGPNAALANGPLERLYQVC
jgi:hypothetical protein